SKPDDYEGSYNENPYGSREFDDNEGEYHNKNLKPPKPDDNEGGYDNISAPLIATIAAENTEQIQPTQINIQVQKSPPTPPNDYVVTTRFHVMMPKMPSGLIKKHRVYVIGNIKELGMSTKGIIQLKQHKKNSMYWYSDPVSIPLSAFQEGPIQYSYFIYKGKKRLTWISRPSRLKSQDEEDDPDITVGDWISEKVDHELISKENQYDLWKQNNSSSMNLKDLKENYSFHFMIYNSITPGSLKDKIIEYQDINKRHSVVLDNDMTLDFVFTCLSYYSTVEQQIFLFVLLGYIINEKMEFNLPRNFPSVKLLEAFNGVNENHLPHDVIAMLSSVVSALVRHASTYSAKFEWMEAFRIAPFADPNYAFLEKVKKPIYTKDNIFDFQDSLNKIVKPCMDNISDEHEETYVNVCKTLIKLCNDLGVVLFLWKHIFRLSVKLDEEFIQYFLDRISNFIARDNAKELYNHLEEIPIDIDINFAPLFRDRALFLLRNPGTSWGKSTLDAIFRLLHHTSLRWQNASVLQAFEYIATSQNPELLQVFPNRLDSFLREGLMDEKVSKICALWLKNLSLYIKKVHNLDRNFVFMILYHLEIVYQIAAKNNITCDELFEVAEREIKALSDDVMFYAATDAEKLKQARVIDFFSRILKEKFGPDVRNIDDIVFHIMTRLYENLPEAEINPNDTNFIKALLASSNFWIYILTATGSTERLYRQNVYVKIVHQAIIKLVLNLRNMSIEIGMLKEILTYDDDRLLNFVSIVENDNVSLMIDITVLQSLRYNYKEYMEKLKSLEIFYNKFCKSAVDVQDYIDDIKSKLNVQEKVILQDAFSEPFWKIHQPMIDIAQSVYIYIDSQTFRNVLDRHSKARGVTLTVELLATRFIREAFIKYNKIRAEYRDWMTLDYTRVGPFWKDVKDIDYELELMSRGMKWYPRDDLKKAIGYLDYVKLWRERIDDLEKTLRIFRVQNVVDTVVGWQMAINEINRSITNFDANCWKVIRALSFAGDLLTWLYTVAEVDLRNLMNSVDDGSEDREVQENTIASLIEVKTFLVPLMNSMRKLYKEGNPTHTIIYKFLDQIRDIASKNPSLSQKISQCCLSNLAIQNVYFSILNRGEATKIRIRDVATIGGYKFFRDKNYDKCTVELSYEKPYEDTGRTKTTTLDLSNLQDVQGQALLIAKQASFAYVMSMSTENENNLEQGAIELMNFVQQINIVHQIVKKASQLMELGHFSYREWEMYVHATDDMKSHLEKLETDLHDW
ncbi:28589_t:CDS:2, partial [Racocetra persica]